MSSVEAEENEDEEESEEERERESSSAEDESESEEEDFGTARSGSKHALGTHSHAKRSGASAIVLSGLKLTAKAATALARHKPSASTLGVSFTLSAPDTVQVTLSMQTSVHGHERWTMLPDSLTANASKGSASRNLTGHNRLSPGRYRLTATPTAGRAHSIYLSVRR